MYKMSFPNKETALDCFYSGSKLTGIPQESYRAWMLKNICESYSVCLFHEWVRKKPIRTK